MIFIGCRYVVVAV